MPGVRALDSKDLVYPTLGREQAELVVAPHPPLLQVRDPGPGVGRCRPRSHSTLGAELGAEGTPACGGSPVQLCAVPFTGFSPGRRLNAAKPAQATEGGHSEGADFTRHDLFPPGLPLQDGR